MPDPRLVRLFDLDPDLAASLPGDDWSEAHRAAVGVLEQRAPGPWDMASGMGERMGGVIVAGLVVRELSLGPTVSAELLAAGDVLLPVAQAPVSFLPTECTCMVLEPLSVVWLGATFEQAACRWPELSRTLLRRAHTRAQRSAVMQNIAQVTRIDDRVLTLLWHLAERFGRVSSEGVVLPLRLTHRVIARLIGARRPSVTTAITALENRAAVQRRAAGSWLLRELPDREGPPGAGEGSPWSDARAGTPRALGADRALASRDAGS
jgi:CRP/FNR family transcriptional regulator, cyclic AMP receptor protein